MEVELENGTVKIGLAEIKGGRRKERIGVRCMALVADEAFLFSFFFLFSVASLSLLLILLDSRGCLRETKRGEHLQNKCGSSLIHSRQI